ncbi:putative copper amine oxidase [Podospora fimiseda]|uniref:Amine oxidase n=1 Tax=Podospora fimiseda TaxID=252190 RepID=A0AAN7H4F5_9PEZI|nr:putative copper amine oxidase [Podospora fimiseda]
MVSKSVVAALLATAVSSAAARPDPQLWKRAISLASDEVRTCSIYDEAPETKAPKENPWAPISPEDTKAVWAYLHDPATGLNLTLPANATLTDNYVFFMDTLHLNKTEVLSYIDGNGEKPPQYARVIIFEGGKIEPVSQEYMVGPLPFSDKTTIQPYDYVFNGGKGGSIPFDGRYFDGKRSAGYQSLLKNAMAEVADITKDLFDGVYYGNGDNRTDLVAASTGPNSWDGTQSFITIMFRYPGLASYMTPIDFYAILDTTGTDITTWSFRGYVTNTRFFPTAAELRAAYEAGELANEFPQTRDQTWANMERKGEMGVRDLDDRAAPQSLEVGGKRYKVDKAQNYIEYMGWSFYVSFTRILGVMFYDIKYKGERIIYELSLQEAAAQYAGNQPKAANTVYHDTYFSIGTYSATLVEGFDCPFGATMFNLSFPGSTDKTETHPQALCIFEADSGYPLARHRYGSSSNPNGFSHLASVKSSALHLRHVATVGNYDYLFDYAFHIDGSLEIEVRASGYLQSSPYYKDQGNFGPRVYQGTQGSYHDHVLTFKADFDLIDAKNSLQRTDLVVVNQTQPWFPELGIFEQMELKAYNMEKEQQFNFAPNGQSMFCIINEDKVNKWGTPRGYRIVPGRSNIHLSIDNSPFSRKSSKLLMSQLAVTKQHDTEPYANSWQNVNLPLAPQQDFAKFFDDESIENEDIVLWFNLGMHHFTRSEDVPVTLYSEAVSSIVFAPQNFNDRAQESDLLNRRWIISDPKTGAISYEDYGVELPTCKVALEEPSSKILPWSTV